MHGIAVVLAPEEEPSGESGEKKGVEETRAPEVMEGCHEPRTATGMWRGRWERGNGGRACIAGRGWQSRLRRRTTPEWTRKEKFKETESWKLGA